MGEQTLTIRVDASDVAEEFARISENVQMVLRELEQLHAVASAVTFEYFHPFTGTGDLYGKMRQLEAVLNTLSVVFDAFPVQSPSGADTSVQSGALSKPTPE